MGVILSRFRKKKSPVEVLESLENEMKEIEEYGQSTERQHKAVVGRLLLFSVGLYVLTACLFYFFFFPASLYDQLLYVIPLLLFPLIIVFVKRLVSWWYRRKLSRNQEKLIDMRKQKKELLEDVMDKETYKVARQILEKFAPDQLRKTNTSPTSSSVVSRNSLESSKSSNQLPLALPHRNLATSSPIGSPGTELRRRTVGNPLTSTPLERAGGRQSHYASPHLSSAGTLTSGAMQTTSATIGAGAVVAAANDDDAAVAAAAGRGGGGGGGGGGVTAASATATATPITSTTTTTTTDDLSVAAAGDASFASTGTTISPTIDNSDEVADIEDEDENEDETVSDMPASAEINGGNGEKYTEQGIHKGSLLGVASAQPVLFRPILPRERTVMDRLVEYIVGDGLNQRYALICRGCGSHNGMALKEEFEYLAFRCCYCFHWNPARKQRLQAPRIDALQSSENTTTSSSAGESNTEEEEELSSKSKEAIIQQDRKESKSEPYGPSSSTSSSDETPVTLANDTKESKSEQYVSKAPTSTSDGNHVTLAGEFADSPSSTETEFESLVPDHSLLTQQLLDLPNLCDNTNLPSSH